MPSRNSHTRPHRMYRDHTPKGSSALLRNNGAVSAARRCCVKIALLKIITLSAHFGCVYTRMCYIKLVDKMTRNHLAPALYSTYSFKPPLYKRSQSSLSNQLNQKFAQWRPQIQAAVAALLTSPMASGNIPCTPHATPFRRVYITDSWSYNVIRRRHHHHHHHMMRQMQLGDARKTRATINWNFNSSFGNSGRVSRCFGARSCLGSCVAALLEFRARDAKVRSIPPPSTRPPLDGAKTRVRVRARSVADSVNEPKFWLLHMESAREWTTRVY